MPLYFLYMVVSFVVELWHDNSCQLYIYVALTVFSHSYYGYCKSYCRIDYVIPYAVVIGMVTPPDEIEFTNTISGVLCISDTLL